MNKKFDFFDLILIAITIFIIGLVLGKLDAKLHEIKFELSSIISIIISALTLFITYSALQIAIQGLNTWRTQKNRELSPKIYSSILNIDMCFGTMNLLEATKSIEGDIELFIKINSTIGNEICLLQTNILDYKNYKKKSHNIDEIEKRLTKVISSYGKYRDNIVAISSEIATIKFKKMRSEYNSQAGNIILPAELSDSLFNSLIKLYEEVAPEIKIMSKYAEELFKV